MAVIYVKRGESKSKSMSTSADQGDSQATSSWAVDRKTDKNALFETRCAMINRAIIDGGRGLTPLASRLERGSCDLKIWMYGKALAPGLLLSLLLAAFAWFGGRMLPLVGAPVLGILFGMAVAPCAVSPALREGTRFVSKRLLQLSEIGRAHV